ncbi:MAG: hypothetical protein K6G81_07350 [Lachnospiraceae bacterium]|nr:hypothetical protein [Lachnospiraceae bacterium]
MPYLQAHILYKVLRADNLKVIRSIMDHADIETTMDIYTEITDMRKKRAFEAATEKGDIF